MQVLGSRWTEPLPGLLPVRPNCVHCCECAARWTAAMFGLEACCFKLLIRRCYRPDRKVPRSCEALSAFFFFGELVNQRKSILSCRHFFPSQVYRVYQIAKVLLGYQKIRLFVKVQSRMCFWHICGCNSFVNDQLFLDDRFTLKNSPWNVPSLICFCLGKVLPADRGAEPAVPGPRSDPAVVQVHCGGGRLQQLLPGSHTHHHLQYL